MTAQPEREIIRHGDLLVDAATGEVVGLVRPKGWEPTSADDVEWLLGILDREQTEAAALRRRATNLIAQAERHDRTVGFLRGRYAQSVARVIAELLEASGSKRRSYESREGYGRLGFRMSRGRTIVVDQDAAIRWAETHAPDAVRRQVEVLVSRLPDGEVPGVVREAPVLRFFWAEVKS